MTYKITIRGTVPSKKNDWKPVRGRLIIPKEVQAQIDSLELVARSEWRGRPRLDRAVIRATFFVHDVRADLDNAYTTLQDVLVKAGILKNDNMKCVPQYSASCRMIPPMARYLTEYTELRIRALDG